MILLWLSFGLLFGQPLCIKKELLGNRLIVNKMSNFKKIDEARKLLGLGERATLQEIKSAYQKLSLKFHPDRCEDSKKKNCEETFKKISDANDILMNYCAGYSYSFTEKDVKRDVFGDDYYQHLKRFYDGWLGDLDL